MFILNTLRILAILLLAVLSAGMLIEGNGLVFIITVATTLFLTQSIGTNMILKRIQHDNYSKYGLNDQRVRFTIKLLAFFMAFGLIGANIPESEVVVDSGTDIVKVSEVEVVETVTDETVITPTIEVTLPPTATPTIAPTPVPKEFASAKRKAQIYADDMYMSKSGIKKQLTSEYGEGFPEDASEYAINNIDVNWKTNAVEKARFYQDGMSMSLSAIHNQLTSEYGEQFTKEEADYAIEQLK